MDERWPLAWVGTAEELARLNPSTGGSAQLLVVGHYCSQPRGRMTVMKGGCMGTWQFDPFHTQVEFSAKHLGMMTVRGHFPEVTVTGTIDVEHPENSSVEAVIQTASIRTHNETRDNDLRSSNFLETEKYPTMTFKSTRIEPAGGEPQPGDGGLT